MLSTDPTHAVGCDQDLYGWCTSLTQVNIYLYYGLNTLLLGVCFASINVSMNTIFSRVIGPRLQGTHQGYMLVAEGCARMLGPLLVGYLYSHHGPRWVWALECGVIAVMMGVWVGCYHRLVPLVIPDEEVAEQVREEGCKMSGIGDLAEGWPEKGSISEISARD